MIEVKMHKEGVLSLCDQDILGKTLSENGVEIKISEHFYLGEQCTEDELRKLVDNAQNINAAGKESVELLLKLNAIQEEHVRLIQGVPMALVFQV